MWCGLVFHGAFTRIKGGILTVKCSKLSALCWKRVKPERLLIGQVPMVRWSDTINWFWITWEVFLGNQQRLWDTYLPPLGMSVRSMVNRNTGFTPNFLQLGREVHMPADVMFGMPVEMEGDKEPADYARQLVDKLGVAYAEVRANLRGGAEASENVLWRQCSVERVRGGRFGLPKKGCLEAWIEQEALPSVHRSVSRHQGVVSLSISGEGSKRCLGVASW